MKKFFFILLAIFLFVSCGGDDPEPEYSAVQGTLNGTCYPNKTCNEGLDCSDENICIKTGDLADSGDLTDSDSGTNTTDSSDSSPDNDSSDTSDSENSDSSDSVSDNDPAENEAECGNGTKEAGEVCEKGEYVKCETVSSEFVSNFALCNETCNGWNTEKCEKASSNVQPIFTLAPVTYDLNYLYNGTNAFKEGANQENEIKSDAPFKGKLTLSSGETVYEIPNPYATMHWMSAFYESGVLMFNQTSFDDDGTIATPLVNIAAATSVLKQGSELPMGISNDYSVNFWIEDFYNNQDCVLLVGYGTLKVDSVNISAGSAGNFKFTTSEIGLYNVTATPEGDVTNELEKAGFTICK